MLGSDKKFVITKAWTQGPGQHANVQSRVWYHSAIQALKTQIFFSPCMYIIWRQSNGKVSLFHFEAQGCLTHLHMATTKLSPPIVVAVFLNGPMLASFCLFSFYFKYKNHSQNCKFQRDSNYDLGSWWAYWTLDHHQGPPATVAVFVGAMFYRKFKFDDKIKLVHLVPGNRATCLS